jgi:LuxR family transcriptional regulator, maltose regulon positive regulatory protein
VGVPLLESKLHLPRRRPGTVSRRRLERLLQQDDLPAVVLVSAPAGFGKTTLLTEWLGKDVDRDPSRTAWLSLDRRDSDPAVFWTYVIAAIRRIEPDAGVDALAALQSTPSTEVLVTALLNDLAALDDELLLVLDDYHVVESVEVHESTRFLVEHLPAQLHLLVTSRADPPWPLARLRARGDLLEIRAADLRFTAEEATTYLNGTMGLALTTADVDTLDDRTEGWIAALQLAALSLQGRDDPGSFIAGFTGDDRFVVDYLVDEVLDRQPDEIRAFLLETSMLGRMSTSLCAAVTGRADASTILGTLERSNLFLVTLDDHRRWFRYHHLFADVLRARLLAEHPDVPSLHRRAAEWFDENGDRPEAIRHALVAGDHARAAELIELAVPDLRQARQDATLRQLLDALPAEIFVNRPVLALGLVGSHMVTGDVRDVEQHLDAIDRWLEPTRTQDELVVHDHAEFRRLPAQAAMYRAALALLRGDLGAAIVAAERAAELSGPDDHLGRGAAAALLGLAAWTDGDLDAAHRAYASAIAEFDAAGFHADILGCSLGLADIEVAQGRLDAAERTFAAGLERAARHGPIRGTADMHVGLAELHLERNEVHTAAEQLQASLELGEHLALGQHAYRWRVVDARLRAVAGDHAGALELLRDAEERYDTDYSPKVRPVAATAARIRLAAGDLEGVSRWVEGSGFTPGDEPHYLREYEHLTYARVLLASGQASDAIPLLERLLGAAETGGREGSAIDTLALLALAHVSLGDTSRALTALDEALDRARTDGFVRTFLDLGPPMTALLEMAVRRGRAADLASAVLTSGAPPATRRPQGLVDELSSRERDVLRLLRSELSGPEIAAELVVSLNTVRTHTKNIFMKLGVNSRRAAVQRADGLGL